MDGDLNVGQPEFDTVSKQEAQKELDKLLADPQFHSTDRNRSFLRFVANELFEGRACAIKAYTIAVDVFGRPCSFDPTTDPIVRIEATRLRASLTQYYEAKADEAAIRIELPRGRYVPIFTKAPSFPESSRDIVAPSHRSSISALHSKDLVRSVAADWRRWIGIAAFVAFAGLCAIWFLLAQRPVFSDKPSVAIEMAADQSSDEANLLHDYLMIALSQFQTFRMAAEDTSIAARTSGVAFFHPTRPVATPYRVVLKYHVEDGARSVWWQIINSKSREALRSGVERVLIGTRTSADVRQELVTNLANRLAGSRSIINTIELEREWNGPTLGNGCILRSIAALEQFEPSQLSQARTCLEATLAAAPNDPDANAQLALVLLQADLPEASTGTAAQALTLASRAAAFAPLSDRAEYARMLALFRNGQAEAAFISGYHAMSLNPNNSLIPAQLGALMFAKGRWAEASGLAVKAGLIENVPHMDAEIVLALDAYRRDEFAEALLRMQQMGSPHSYVPDILELAAAGQLGNAHAALEPATRLTAKRQDFRKAFRSEFEARQYVPVIIDGLDEGLQKAGSLLQRVALNKAGPLNINFAK